MEDLIQVITKPAELTVNYETLAKAVKEEVTKHSVVVTKDTVGEAKALIQKLNKTKKALDGYRKSSVEEATRPAREFDGKMKELITHYSDGARDLRTQIQHFEDEEKAVILGDLQQYQKALWESYSVKGEFRQSSVEDLALLGAVTPKGAMKAATKKEVEARINKDREQQQIIAVRLDELTTRSQEAGLKSPLTRDLVEHFLFRAEGEYEASLTRLLDGELIRQQQAIEAVRAEVAKLEEQPSLHAHEKPATEQIKAPPGPVIPTAGPVTAPSTPIIPAASTTDNNVTVDCTFNFTAPDGLSDEAIEKHLADALKKIGVTAEATFSVRRRGDAA